MKEQPTHTYQTFPHIELHPSIPKRQIQRLSTSTQFSSQFFTLILYNYLETPKLQDFLQTSIQAEGELCLVRKEIKTGNYQFLSQDDKEYEYFLLYMVNENTPLINEGLRERPVSGVISSQIYELKPILTTLISLSDKVVVFDLDKQKQSFIEKLFVDSVTTCQKIKWQTTFNRVHRLVFVRQCYKQQKMHSLSSHKTISKQQFVASSSPLTATTSLDTLQYYSSLKQYKQHIQQQKQRYMYFRSQFQLLNDNQFIDKLIKQRKVIKKISLKEILHIYEKIMEMMERPVEDVVLESLLRQFLIGDKDKGSERQIHLGMSDSERGQKFVLGDPWKVRYYIEKVYELQTAAKLYSTIEQEIFYPDVSIHRAQHVHKQIKKYLSSPQNPKHNNLMFSHTNFSHFQYVPTFMSQITLSPDSRQKLLWKLNRLHKYQRQLHEQSKISPLNSASRIFYELQDDELTYWLEKYSQKWTEQSLGHLKTYFNRIANIKDHKAIQQFKQECYKMQQRLLKYNSEFNPQQQALIKKIQLQLNSFVEYHNDVLEMKRFAGIRYFWKDCGYVLRFKQNIRNKIMLVGLILLLALMQKNVVAGLTLGTMALVVLAIRLS